MGWTWTCFGGKKERVRRVLSDRRVLQKNEEKPSRQAPSSPSLQSLGAHLKSAKEVAATAYEELFQPKQAVSGTPHGIKLFKRRSVRRAKSCGNNSAFENGGNGLFDKSGEGRRMGRVDQLQEEVEVLRKRLAEEEEEARKLRNEVCFLRSCGVIQSPDRHRLSLSLEKESLLLKDDGGQRNWQSWLGLSLSPKSRFRLEEHLRSMAADELSKVPRRGLTNGQKALIVATKLWQSQGDSNQDYQSEGEPLKLSCTTDDDSRRDSWGCRLPKRGGDAISNHDDTETAYSDLQMPSKCQEPCNFPCRDDSCRGKTVKLKSPRRSASSEMENFSFHPQASDDKMKARHVFLADSPLTDVPRLRRISSCPDPVPHSSSGSEQEDTIPGSTAEKMKFESPNRSSSLPNFGTESHTTSDPSEHVQARRFIDLRYHELEEKLLRSPTKEKVQRKSTAENSPPRLSNGRLPGGTTDSEQEVSLMTVDVNLSDGESGLDGEANYVNGSPPTPVMTPLFACKSGRLWQPLSPVREVDSGLSSVDDLESKSVSRVHVSGSAESSLISELKSSMGPTLSGSEWGQHDELQEQVDDMSEGPDDDLFTLSPRRLHHSYNPWEDVNRPDESVQDDRFTALQADSGSVADWASSEDADFDDFVPIQCQSPAFSPKKNSLNTKFSKEKVLMVEYARDRYFKDMGLNVEEFISSSDSRASFNSAQDNKDGTEMLLGPNINGDSPGVGKENNDGIEPLSLGQVIMAGSRKEASPIPKKLLIANDVTHSQESDHPVLASIENLPKWIECVGVPTTSVDNREIQEDTPILESDEMPSAQQDVMNESSKLNCDSIAGGDLSDNKEDHNPIHKLAKDLELGSCLEEPNDDRPTLEFSARQEVTHNHYDYDREEERLRLSLHGFVYPGEQGLHPDNPKSIKNLVPEKSQDHHQIETEDMVDELSYPGKQEKRSLSLQSVSRFNATVWLVETEEHQDIERVDSECTVTLDRQVSCGQQIQSSHEQNTQQEVEKRKKLSLDSDFRKDVLSHVQSLGYSIQIPKQRDFSAFIEDPFESPSVGGDSEVSSATSRDRDEIFHDCESPTLSESNPEPTDYNYLAETNSDTRKVMPSRLGNVREEVPARRIWDISPDDRPILGTVATYWGGENDDPKSLREWDGLGIPNSTSKFKEDQFVNWHTTPFETRLEQALASLPVPELCNRRNLFGGGSIV